MHFVAATPWHLSPTHHHWMHIAFCCCNLLVYTQFGSYCLHTQFYYQWWITQVSDFSWFICLSLMCRLCCPALQFAIWTASRAPVFGPTPTLVADTWHMSTHISQSLLHSYKTIYTIKITATATTLISLFTCLLLMNFLVAELLVWWWRFADADEVEGLCWRMTTILK